MQVLQLIMIAFSGIRTHMNVQLLDGFIEPGKNVKPFMATQVLIQYNTGHDEKDVSNIFIKYDYVSNFVGNNTKGYHNNFWQFQIGYSKDITDIFRKKDGLLQKKTQHQNLKWKNLLLWKTHKLKIHQ